MCVFCNDENIVCPACGRILNGDLCMVTPPMAYCLYRKQLEESADRPETIVYCLFKNTELRKVSWGTLRQVYNETKPNGNYVGFDYSIIYIMNSEAEARILCAWLMGLTGAKGSKVPLNLVYKKPNEIAWKSDVSLYTKDMAIQETKEFEYKGIPYCNIVRLSQMGLCNWSPELRQQVYNIIGEQEQ